MQEIRCRKCHKTIGKIHRGFAGVEVSLEIEGNISNSVNGAFIEIQCPHNYRDENGKNVQCKTLNKIII